MTGEGFNSGRHDLPSWVRDFDHRPDISALRHEMTRMQGYNLYHSSRTRLNPACIIEGSSLGVKGVHIDTIAAVGQPLTSMDWRSVGSVLESWHSIAGIRVFERPWAHARQKSFWRTMLADTVFDVESKMLRRCNANDVNEFHNWLMKILVTWAIGIEPPLKDCFVLAFLAATYGRVLFVTSQGKVGLCYDVLNEGDEIWALQGGMVPFILRNKYSARNGARAFAFVADCYLDGFMDGEAFEPVREDCQVILQ
jgi:hypothetical protein